MFTDKRNTTREMATGKKGLTFVVYAVGEDYQNIPESRLEIVIRQGKDGKPYIFKTT